MKTITITIGETKFEKVSHSRVLTYKQRAKGMEIALKRQLTNDERVEALNAILEEPMRAGGLQYLTTPDKDRLHNLIFSNLEKLNGQLDGEIVFADGKPIYQNNGVSADLIIFCKKRS